MVDEIPEEFVWKTGLELRLILGDLKNRWGALQEIHCKRTNVDGEYEGVIYRMVCICDFPKVSDTIRITCETFGDNGRTTTELECRITEISPVYRTTDNPYNFYSIADVVKVAGAKLITK